MTVVYPLVPIIAILLALGFLMRSCNRTFAAINQTFDAQSKRMGLLAERITMAEQRLEILEDRAYGSHDG